MDQWKRGPGVEVPDEAHHLEMEKEWGDQTKVLLLCRGERDLGVLEEKKQRKWKYWTEDFQDSTE